MDPVIQAVIAGATRTREVPADVATREAYAALKAGLRERLGPKVRVTQALEVLEERPSDQKAKDDIEDAITRAMMGKPAGEKLTALASQLMSALASQKPSESVRSVIKSVEVQTESASPKPDKKKAESPKARAVEEQDARLVKHEEASKAQPSDSLIDPAPKLENIKRRRRPMPAPQTVRKTREALIFLVSVLVLSVLAIVFLTIQEASKPKAPPKKVKADPVVYADPPSSSPSAEPPQSEPAKQVKVDEVPTPEPVKTQPQAPAPVPMPAEVKPIEAAAKPTMKAEDLVKARRLLHALRNQHALLERGRKKPRFKADEDLLLTEIAKSESVSVDEVRPLVAEYLAAVGSDDGATDEDKAVAAFENGRFDVAAKSGMAAADALASKAASGKEGDAQRKAAITLCWLAGLAEQEMGRVSNSVAAFEKGAELTDQERDPVTWADARLLLATAVQRKGIYPRALDLLELVMPVYKKALGEGSPKLAIAAGNQASALLRSGKLTFVEPLMNRALALDEKRVGHDHPDVATDLSNLAGFFLVTDRVEKAEELYQRAMGINEKALGSGHPAVAVDLGNLANVMRSTGRVADAESYMRRALSVDEKASGPDHPDVAVRLNNLAHLLAATKRTADAEATYRKALKINELALGPEHAVIGVTATQLGELLLNGGKKDEAEGMFRRAVKIAERNLEPDDPVLAVRLSNLAELLRSQGRADEAESLYARALQIDEKHYGLVHPCVATDLTGLADVYEKTNRLQEALPLYRRALKIAYIIRDETGKGHPEVDKWENSFSTAMLAVGWSPDKILGEIRELKASVARK